MDARRRHAVAIASAIALLAAAVVVGGVSAVSSASRPGRGTHPGSTESVPTEAIAKSRTATTAAGLAIRVRGGSFVGSDGAAIQLRGVNASSIEFVAIQGWDPANPWGGAEPDFAAMATRWKANVVRIPLNEDSWLGLTCAPDPTDLGVTRKADPGGDYRASVESAVAAANRAGLRVILDLHWAAPDLHGVPLCAMTQNAMADADNGPAFWRSVASTFRTNPSVMFELFNEPFLGEWPTTGGTSIAARVRDGGTATGFLWGYTTASGAWAGGTDENVVWKTAGMQSLLDAVRSTGATNVVLVGSDSWSQEVSEQKTTLPHDPLHQLAAAWHPYPDYDYGSRPQVRCVGLPSCSATEMADAAALVCRGVPVIATEFGDDVTSAPSGSSPWSSILLPFADAHGISYVGWTWDVWQDTANVLIRDAAGDPSYGFGEYVRAHFLCRADGTC